jgi:hypothetical protein
MAIAFTDNRNSVQATVGGLSEYDLFISTGVLYLVLSDTIDTALSPDSGKRYVLNMLTGVESQMATSLSVDQVVPAQVATEVVGYGG